ncbi:hypothetical protein JAAARDRAFT_41599 [Jaapia argillacea MUCL 33604]|uniref:Alpha/beta hydrolase fold-3 domain-containing protein n=1 Tax=Jaapia argillacea MUCL 33604 TaxID=933084 RepID=A0A067PKL5_9AGAM|nr:hypothetical protein JAAARDRAFT_41599 [Jaapia argillacea MUCL 33604]
MVKVLHHQPFKGIYLTYLVFTLVFFRLPIWILYYLNPGNRPRRTWTLKRCLAVEALRIFVALNEVNPIQGRDPTKEVPDNELTDAKFVWVNELADDVFCGEVRRAADQAKVVSSRLPGYWLLKKGMRLDDGWRARPKEKTLLHLHGGLFYIGSGHPSDLTASITRGLLQHSTVLRRTFAADYRLAASYPNPPKNPFPTAVVDALAAYQFLIRECEFEPENVIVMGDSAGGNIALALVRHLVENPIPSLPPPGKLLLMSPWADLSSSRVGPGSSQTDNIPSDLFNVQSQGLFGDYGVTSLLGSLDLGEAKTNRYLSPASAHIAATDGLFTDFPETFVVAGGAERLLDDSKVLIERMESDGVRVSSAIPPDAVHDYFAFAWHEPERTETLRTIGRWIDGT